MIYVLGFLIALNAMAAECLLYKLQGDVTEKQGLYLQVNKDTNSQRNFLFSRDIEFEMGPYFNRTVSGKFVLKDTTIVKIEEVKPAVPDPLFHHEEMVRLSTVPCPQGKTKKAPKAP